MSRIKQMAEWWEAERHRRFLFVASFFPVGMALYFALPFEPPMWVLIAAAMLALAALLWRWSRLQRHSLWLVATLMLLGAAWGSFFTWHLHLTILAHALDPRPVSGVVDEVERTDRGMRITLDDCRIEDIAPADTPARIRLTLRLKDGIDAAPPEVGQRISLMAGLLPPMGPPMPHGFDFARYFYFHEMGAVGYGLPPWRVESDTRSGLYAQFANWRIHLTDDIISFLGPRDGPIAAGLITGDARAIQPADYDALKAANLYHIIAISGGHMVVIAGMLMLLARLLTLCLPASLRYRPAMKSVAATVALLFTTAYLYVTGLPPSAVRAYVMIALVLLAIIFRRHVDPMRSLVITALLMMLWNPANLFDPGFQLSFAATLAIVALVERMFLRSSQAGDSWAYTTGKLLLASVLVSAVAELATVPLIIAQFNQFGIYGIPSNFVATPLVDFFMMPLVAVYFLLLPFHLGHYALAALDLAIRALLGIATTVAPLPHALHYVPSLPDWGVACYVAGLLWFCFWLKRPHWLGIPLMLLGTASLFTVSLPDILVGPELKQVALHTDHGYVLARGKEDSLIPQLWANGLGYFNLPSPDDDSDDWRCDHYGCIAHIQSRLAAFPQSGMALPEDCTRADLLITDLKAVTCSHAYVINGDDLWHGGATSVWLHPFRVENSAMWQGDRPWSAH